MAKKKAISTFGDAIEAMKAGECVTRDAGDGVERKIVYFDFVEESVNRVCARGSDGRVAPWGPTVSDMVATNWEIAEPAEEEVEVDA